MTPLYGLKVLTPEMCVQLVVVKPTRWQFVRGALYEVWFNVSQAALFALSFVCFAYAFRHLG